MTTLGSINSQNRVANYSANYRGPLFSAECACYYGLYTGPGDYRRCRPIICHRVWSSTRSSRALFPPYPWRFVTRVWSDSVSVECGICKNKHRKHGVAHSPAHGVPRAGLFGVRPHLYTRVRSGPDTRKRLDQRVWPDLQSIRWRNGWEFESESAASTRELPPPFIVFSLLFSSPTLLYLSFFLFFFLFHFRTTSKRQCEAKPYNSRIKMRNT